MTLDPHTALFVVLTMGIGYVMVIAGLGKNALELRRNRRTCPSCGRLRSGRSCACSR